MAFRSHFLVLASSLLVMVSCTAEASDQVLPLSATIGGGEPAHSIGPTRRVNAPRFDDGVQFSETAILWFGRVTPTENSADARVGYNDDYLFVRVGAFDRRLWYDTSPSPVDLLEWDAVTLYLDLDGNTGSEPDTNAHRFDAQLVWWEPREEYEAAYVGDGSDWVASTVPFTTTSFWRGDVPNDNSVDDRGWALTFYVPFDSLGLSAPPAQESIWGMALALHDRDDMNGGPIPDQTWPEAMGPGQPATWGQLAFGFPAYQSQSAIPEGTLTVRHGLDGASVKDGDVGGSSVCGAQAEPDFFPSWGDLNYAGELFLNVQNLGDIGDWPCFSRYYVTFPLDALPPERVIISATLTLYQFGNAGEGEDPQPSLIQVLTVDRDWDEDALTWNAAPLAVENVASAWADVFPEQPGEPRQWDVSRAVAQAYAAGLPLRLALYESDWHYHSGKYFWSSNIGDYEEQMRPALAVTWGRALAQLDKSVISLNGGQGTQISYSLNLLGSGNELSLTDTLPVGISAPVGFDLEGTDSTPVYDGGQHVIAWTDTPALGQEVIIRYTAHVATGDPVALVNSAHLLETGGGSSVATATFIANPYRVFHPVILRDE